MRFIDIQYRLSNTSFQHLFCTTTHSSVSHGLKNVLYKANLCNYIVYEVEVFVKYYSNKNVLYAQT